MRAKLSLEMIGATNGNIGRETGIAEGNDALGSSQDDVQNAEGLQERLLRWRSRYDEIVEKYSGENLK